MPRAFFDMNQWIKPLSTMPFAPTTLEIFDPFDNMDTMLGHNMHWLNKPEFKSLFPAVPQKYRITVDCFGYKPKSITCNWINNKLVVCGREEVKDEHEDFSIKEFKKSYDLPVNAVPEKLVSFFTGGQFVIDVPLKETPLFKNSELVPQIIDTMEGGKVVEMTCAIPEGICPTKIHVTCKDRDLIIKAEDCQKKPDGITKFHYFKKSTFPVNTKFEDVKCTFDKNLLTIKAPLDMDFKAHMCSLNVPVKDVFGINYN
jgi:HSP20 family molecular chaperone IbpA